MAGRSTTHRMVVRAGGAALLAACVAGCTAFASPGGVAADVTAMSYHAKYQATTLWCALLVIPGTVVTYSLFEVARRGRRRKPLFRTRLDSQSRRRAASALDAVRSAAGRARELTPSDDDASARQLGARRRLLDIAAAAGAIGDPYQETDGRNIAALVVFGRLAGYFAVELRAAEEQGDPPQACFFDPMHHRASGERAWRGGSSGQVRVPVCGECSRALGSGDAPSSLGVRHGRKVVPYWTRQDEVFTTTGFGAFGDLAAAVVDAEQRPPGQTEAARFHTVRHEHRTTGRRRLTVLPIGIALLMGVIGAVITVGTQPLTGSAHGHVILLGIPVFGVYIGLLVGLLMGGASCLPISLCLLIVRKVKKAVNSVESHGHA